MPLTPGGKRFLVGCLVTAGVLLLIVIVAGVLFTRWIKSPTPLLEAARLLEPETAVYIEVRLRSEDPGVREFVRAGLTAMRRTDIPEDEKVPSFVRSIFGSVPKREATDKEIDKLLPVIFAVTRRAGPQGEAGPPLFAVSFTHAGNSLKMADWFLTHVPRPGQDFDRKEHGEEEIYTVRTRSRGETTTVAACILGSDVLFSVDEACLTEAIDRLMATPAPPPPDSLPSEFRGRSDETFIFMGARPGYGGTLAEDLSGPLPAIAVALRPILTGPWGVKMTTHLTSADAMEGELRLLEEGAVTPPPSGPSAPSREGAPPPAGEPPGIEGTLSLELAGQPVSLALEPIAPGPGEKKAWKIEMTGLEAVAREGLKDIRHRR